MKKIIVLLALIALAVAPFAAQAGINPASAGLPAVLLVTGDNNQYDLGSTPSVPGNRASVMCVACHTRNPAIRTFYRNTNGYGLTGSHWVTSNFADSSKGGGYSDGTTPKDRTTRTTLPVYFADNTSGNLTVANGWYGAPKYGWLNGGVVDNTTVRATGTQVICESCHNIVRNLGPAKLLATGFANGGTAQSTNINGVPGTTTPALCIGCHGDMDAGISAEWRYHPLAAGATFGGTHHHRNTPGAAVYLGSGTQVADGGMNNLTSADYNQVIGGLTYQMWAVGPGSFSGTRVIDFTSNPTRVRNVTGTDNGQISPRGGNLMCTNCHRAHNAEATAGATILMRGSDTAAIGSWPAPTDQTNGWRATSKMTDRGGRGGAFSSTNPLCIACHQ